MGRVRAAGKRSAVAGLTVAGERPVIRVHRRVCCWAEPGDYVVAVARRDGVLPAVEREDVQVEAALAAAARSADCGT